MRLRQKPWADREFAENPRFIARPKALMGNWSGLFGNDNEIHLEIGCGKGRFILQNALQNPQINYVAMEKFERILCMALRLTREFDLPPNLYFFHEDAANLPQIFAENELNRIYINFPDPWRAKGKWRKRRLTHRNFLAVYENIMAAGASKTGQVHFKTDDMTLFCFSIAEFEECGWQLSNITYNLLKDGADGNIMTEYEEKFVQKGMKICRLEAVIRRGGL